ncbi:MAG: RNA-binding protein [Chitinispirillaceae bacterium]|nr:RNA-binding protein [Chitinispirillaceae bacterium]
MAQKLYIGNLSFNATEEGLRTLFSQYGEVTSVSLMTDRDTGRPRGFGFVEMENAEAAIAALNEKEFEGRALKVDIARERAPRGDRGGFNNRGGGGGGNFHGGRRFGGRDNRY